jgi:predicted acetyltransferase
MSHTLRWVGAEEADRIAEARLRCYASASKELQRFREELQREAQAPLGAAEYLLAEGAGRLLGTTTAWALTMWVRGGSVPCQGVAWVGTARTQRRKGGAATRAEAGGLPAGAGRSGVATELMFETVRRAREREQVVSALMPFRATFYEHFGYGVVERRCAWTVPLTLLPAGDADGYRYYEPGDLPEMRRTRQQAVESGQCDIERTDWWWAQWLRWAEDGFLVVDRPRDDGPVRGWTAFSEFRERDQLLVRVNDLGFDTPESFARFLRFLGSLRDQYAAALFTTPIDWPVNWMLRERQLVWRPTTYPTADGQLGTRMMLRVLDHRRFIEAMSLRPETRGRAIIAVHESEGGVSRFGVEIEGGRAMVRASDATPDVEMPDHVWAPVVCGAVPASDAAQAGIIVVHNARALPLLDAFAAGPKPFCREAF